MDLSRALELTPWTGIESLKNGELLSGKCHSTTQSFRPHIVILSNRVADGVGAEISADRVVQVELRQFAGNLISQPTAPGAREYPNPA